MKYFLLLSVLLLECSEILGKFYDDDDAPSQKKVNCIFWDNEYIKTYRDDVIQLNPTCIYKLIEYQIGRDVVSVKVQKSVVYISTRAGKNYELRMVNDLPKLVIDSNQYNIPYTLAAENIKASRPERKVIAKFGNFGLEIRWDQKDFVEIIVETEKSVDMDGLCNAKNYDAFKWGTGVSCGDVPSTCSNHASNSHCNSIFSDPKFKQCRAAIPDKSFRAACSASYCKCQERNKNDCLCSLLDAFARACYVKTDEAMEWRNDQLCDFRCKAPQTYMACAPNAGPRSCGEPEDPHADKECREGCFCPNDLLYFQGQCYIKDDCPCIHPDTGGVVMRGQSIKQDCKTCICKAGDFTKNCVPKICYVEGGCWGDPHYTTFDGTKYDFMGKCTYYLVKDSTFSVEGDHYVLENGKFVKNFKSTLPSYTRIVYVRYGKDLVIALKPTEITVNNKPRQQFPYEIDGVTISKPAANLAQVELPNFLQIIFDGHSVVTIRIPTDMKYKTGGLMGYFNGNASDDFRLPNGKVVTDPNIFGHAWKVPGTCEDEFKGTVPHPCTQNPNQKPIAEKACEVYKTDLLNGCKGVDYTLAYDSCLYDCCNEPKLGMKCSCPAIASTANTCAIQGKIIDWRTKVAHCEIKCPTGQVYKRCQNPCEASCDYISQKPECEKHCIEGCGCPDGQTLNEHSKCVPIEKCKCKLNGKYFPADFKYLSRANLHTCSRAKWVIKVATDEEKRTYKTLAEKAALFSCRSEFEYSACKHSTQITCKNMHITRENPVEECVEGCECQQGLVLNTAKNACVDPKDCPCLHEGRSYNELEERRNFIQKCICKNGSWKNSCAVDKDRVDKCSLFGESHIRTFGGRVISFQTLCEYVLAKGSIDKQSFTITAKPDSITLRYTLKNGKQGTMTVNKNGKDFPKVADEVTIYDFTSSKVIAIQEIGVRLVWHADGWFHVHLQPEWRTKVDGMCGKLDLEYVEILTELNELDLEQFAEEWNVDKKCKVENWRLFTKYEEQFEIDGSQILTRCEKLKNSIFHPCNSKLPVEQYYRACRLGVYDLVLKKKTEDEIAVFSNQALSAFAQECNDVGIPVDWRTKENCACSASKCMKPKPIYNSCISTCTCNNLGSNNICKDKSCVEGCAGASCPYGEIYTDSSLSHCVKPNQCHEGPPTTTPGPVVTVKPDPNVSEKRKQLIVFYNSCRPLLMCWANIETCTEKDEIRMVYYVMSSKDKHLVTVFTYYINTYDAEIRCISSLDDTRLCTCKNGKKMCQSSALIDYTQENESKLLYYYDVIKYIDTHAKCLLKLKDTPRNCQCIKGRHICKKDNNGVITLVDTDDTSRVVYPEIIRAEQQIITYFYYIQYFSEQLQCLSSIQTSTNIVCTCELGQPKCEVLPIESQRREEIKKINEHKRITCGQYLKGTEGQLRCYSRIESKSGVCWCEFSKEICTQAIESKTPSETYQIIEKYVETPIVKNQIWEEYEIEARCVESLTEAEHCTCVKGQKVCEEIIPDQNIVVIQKQLWETYTDNKLLLECCKNSKACSPKHESSRFDYHTLSPTDQQRVDRFILYIREQEDEIRCYSNMKDVQSCICENGKEHCNVKPPPKENVHEIIVHFDILKFIATHLKCWRNVSGKSNKCMCISGREICKETDNDKSTMIEIYDKTPVYSGVLKEEQQIGANFIYISYIATQLKCVASMTYSGPILCICENNKLHCEYDPYADEEKRKKILKINEEYKRTTIYYRKHIRHQLQCYANLKIKSGLCRCEYGREVCEDITKFPQAILTYEIVDVYKKTPLVESHIQTSFVENWECVEYLGNKAAYCSCEAQKIVCSSLFPYVTTETKPKPPIKPTTPPPVCVIEMYGYRERVPEQHAKVDLVGNRVQCLLNYEHHKGCLQTLQLISDMELREIEKRVSQQDRQLLHVYSLYSTYIKLQMECIGRKSRYGCSCNHGRLTCPSLLTEEQIIASEKSQIAIYMLFVDYIDSQINCLVRLKDNYALCTCSKHQQCGQETKLNRLVQIIETTIPPHSDRLALYTYLELQLKCCGTMKDRSGKCKCFSGLENCHEHKKTDEQEELVTRREDLDAFYEKQSKCLKNIKPDCVCVKGEQICEGVDRWIFVAGERHAITEYHQTTDQLLLYFQAQIKCLDSIQGASKTHGCVNGVEIYRKDIDTVCEITKCPPNTKMVKKCEHCCPVCESKYCNVIDLNNSHGQIRKKIGEKWSEGPCRECQCLEDKEEAYVSCLEKTCPRIPTNEDIEFEVTSNPESCCPTIRVVGCKHNGKVYPINSIIEKNACETLSCTETQGTLVKRLERIKCKNSCPEGFEQKPKEGDCCGVCVPKGCFDDGKVIPVGSVWYSSDRCLKYTCKKRDNEFIISLQRRCRSSIGEYDE